MAATLQPQDYPVGPKPDWELDAKLGRLKSVLDSCVLSTSLHESRNAWLSRLLPKFASRGPGNKPAVDSPIPPPHQTKILSRCTLEVGPHIMHDLLVHEATYIDPPPEAQATMSVPAPQLQPYGGIDPSSSSSTAPTTPFSNVTDDLVSHVNAAAQRDPHLAHCIRVATAGKASPDEVKYITTTINQLTTTDPTTWRPASPVIAPHSESTNAWDIIFEYRERPNDRWLLPRGLAFIERAPPEGTRLDSIQISMLFSASATGPSSSEASSSTVPGQSDVVTLRLLQPAQMLHDALIDWVGGAQQNLKNRDTLRNTLKKARARQFLQYQLPVASERLAQFKAAAEPPFPMKLIKPDPNAQGKRRRSMATPKSASIQPVPVTKQSEATSSATPKPPPKKRRTKPTPDTPALTSKPRKKSFVYVLVPPPPPTATISHATSRPTIACHHCGTTGVPLLMGGRFCRPCIEAGHATAVPGVTHAPVPAPPVIRVPTTAYASLAHMAAGQTGTSSAPHPPGPSSYRTSFC